MTEVWAEKHNVSTTIMFGTEKAISVNHYSTDVLPECINSRRRRRQVTMAQVDRRRKIVVLCLSSVSQFAGRTNSTSNVGEIKWTEAVENGGKRPPAFPTLLLTPGSTKIQ